MYRRLTDSKMFCSLSYCCVVVNNITRNLHCTLFNISFQKNPLQYLFLHCMQGIFYLFLFSIIRYMFFRLSSLQNLCKIIAIKHPRIIFLETNLYILIFLFKFSTLFVKRVQICFLINSFNKNSGIFRYSAIRIV